MYRVKKLKYIAEIREIFCFMIIQEAIIISSKMPFTDSSQISIQKLKKKYINYGKFKNIIKISLKKGKSIKL